MSEIKTLDGNKLSKLQELEKKIGYCLVAFEPPVKVATISDAQLMQIQALEKELNAVVVAYDCRQ